MPGALSAIGILMSDVVKDYSRTLLLHADKALPEQALDRELRRMRAAATADFRREGWSGALHFAPSLDLRYRGQGFEINVPYTAQALHRFHAEHHRRYGYSEPGRAVEVVTARLRAVLPAAKVNIAPEAQKTYRPTSPPDIRPVWFGNRFVRTPVVDRQTIGRRKVTGPAIITEYSATTVLHPGWRCSADARGNLLLESSQK
jgi:N-methylhydantoinase A